LYKLTIFIITVLLSQISSLAQSSNKQATFDFSPPYASLTLNPKPGTRDPSRLRPVDLDGYTFNASPIEFSLSTDHASTAPQWCNPGGNGTLEVRINEGNILTVRAEQGYKITRLTFYRYSDTSEWDSFDVTPSNGTWVMTSNRIWKMDADTEISEINLTSYGLNYFYKLIVAYDKSDPTGAIDHIKTDIADITDSKTYYTLQGVQLPSEPTIPGIYILVTNKYVSKILIGQPITGH